MRVIACIAAISVLSGLENAILLLPWICKKNRRSVRVYFISHNTDGWVFVCTTIRCLPLHPCLIPSVLLLEVSRIWILGLKSSPSRQTTMSFALLSELFRIRGLFSHEIFRNENMHACSSGTICRCWEFRFTFMLCLSMFTRSPEFLSCMVLDRLSYCCLVLSKR
jgi:hypothetical protein